jgi:hypothetical protein
MARENTETRAGKQGKRLKGVCRRKRARRTGYSCDVMAFKMHLVKKRREEE